MISPEVPIEYVPYVHNREKRNSYNIHFPDCAPADNRSSSWYAIFVSVLVLIKNVCFFVECDIMISFGIREWGIEMDLDCSQYKIIVESSPCMIWRVGKDGLPNFFNTKWLNFTGRTIDQEIKTGWLCKLHPDDMKRSRSIYETAFKEHKPFEIVFRLKRCDGEWRYIDACGTPYFDNQSMFQGLIGSCTDITEKVIVEQLREMAQKDGLTGINNRQYFEQLAALELKKAERYHTGLCAVMTDIDQFKSINDSNGHLTGDRVLQAFARVLSANIRAFDILGRYGGDEFIILLPHTSFKDASASMKRIRGLMKAPLILDEGINMEVTCSYGISELEEDDSLESLVARADREMYRMKNELK